MTWTDKETKLIDEEVSRKPMETTEPRVDVLFVGNYESDIRAFDTTIRLFTDKIMPYKDRLLALRAALDKYLEDVDDGSIEFSFELGPEDLDSFPTSINVKELKRKLEYFLNPEEYGIEVTEYEQSLLRKYGVTPPTDYSI